MSPKVSIIMPAHNAEKYIKEAIESVLTQSEADFELIIVDDASTDKTANIVQQFSDQRIRYEYREPIGSPAGVRNVGLRLAKGEYIAFLDSDDAYLPDSLSSRLIVFKDNSSLNAVYGFARHISQEGNPLDEGIKLRQTSQEQWLLPKEYEHSWPFLVKSSLSCLLPGLMLKRSFQAKIGFFNENLYGPEDYEFYIRMFLEDFNSVYALPYYVYQYRIHNSSLTKRDSTWEHILSSTLLINTWLFEHPKLPAEFHHLKSASRASYYRYFARERLLLNQPKVGLAIIGKGIKDKVISPIDKIRKFFPLIPRCFFPGRINKMMVKLKSKTLSL